VTHPHPLTDADRRINESHGLWEMRVVALAALVAATCKTNNTPSASVVVELRKASESEREAFDNWQKVSRECGA